MEGILFDLLTQVYKANKQITGEISFITTSWINLMKKEDIKPDIITPEECVMFDAINDFWMKWPNIEKCLDLIKIIFERYPFYQEEFNMAYLGIEKCKEHMMEHFSEFRDQILENQKKKKEKEQKMIEMLIKKQERETEMRLMSILLELKQKQKNNS